MININIFEDILRNKFFNTKLIDLATRFKLTYSSWESAKWRVTNPNNIAWQWYGGKGVKMCDKWRYNFREFLIDMGQRPSKDHTLERINSNNNYEPNNCIWILKKLQSNNLTSNILDWNKANEIRELFSTRKYTYREISEKYKCKHTTVWEVVHNVAWYDEDYIPPDLNSERNAFAKAIRDEYKNTYNTFKIISEKFNISEVHCRSIILNNSYFDPNYNPPTKDQIYQNILLRVNNLSKFEAREALEIRLLFISKICDRKELCQLFKCSKTKIDRILRNNMYYDENYQKYLKSKLMI
jgi:hypothetical protein